MLPDIVAEVFDRTARELWLVTAAEGARRSGLIATCVAHASIVPELPRVLLGLAQRHYTCELVEASGAFALHLLGEEQIEHVWRFGLHSGRDGDKFSGLQVERGATASPLLGETLAWLECRVETRMDIGDRTIYLAEIVEGTVVSEGEALTTSRMLELAPPETRRLLKRQLTEDAAADAEAIRRWRES